MFRLPLKEIRNYSVLSSGHFRFLEAEEERKAEEKKKYFENPPNPARQKIDSPTKESVAKRERYQVDIVPNEIIEGAICWFDLPVY